MSTNYHAVTKFDVEYGKESARTADGYNQFEDFLTDAATVFNVGKYWTNVQDGGEYGAIEFGIDDDKLHLKELIDERTDDELISMFEDGKYICTDRNLVADYCRVLSEALGSGLETMRVEWF
jgi:hypothetical protein